MGYSDHPAWVILGPTATGKTRLAAQIAARHGAEILSVDSRQVYRGMDIGTGKDLRDLIVDNTTVPIHLIDLAEPGERLSIFDYLRHFDKVLEDLSKRHVRPLLCGGTGMYLDAILSGYSMPEVPENRDLRSRLNSLEMDELVVLLSSFGPLHNTTDTLDRERLMRAIEIKSYEAEHPDEGKRSPLPSIILGMDLPREELRTRITHRLETRLHDGLIDEVKSLLDMGLDSESLDYYGLEYRFVSRYLLGSLSFDSMQQQLNTAIHQFAKRQVTWFRRMEKRGTKIHWINASSGIDLQIEEAERILSENFV